jgi:uncharacterized protein with PQ loop repeat
MFSMDDFQEGLAWVCGGLVVLYHLPKMLEFYKVVKGQINYEESPGVYTTTCYINCFLWYVYGDMIFSEQIKYSHFILAVISFLCICIYLLFELKKYFLDAILNILILLTGSWASYRALIIIIDDDLIVGKFCFASSILMYLNQIFNIIKVIKEKNYMLIQINSAFLYLGICIGWIIYGLYLQDNFIVAPHIVGTILSMAQIIIFVNFKGKFIPFADKEYNSTIGIESTGNDDKRDIEIKIDDNKEDNIKEKPVKIVNKMDIN